MFNLIYKQDWKVARGLFEKATILYVWQTYFHEFYKVLKIIFKICQLGKKSFGGRFSVSLGPGPSCRDCSLVNIKFWTRAFFSPSDQLKLPKMNLTRVLHFVDNISSILHFVDNWRYSVSSIKWQRATLVWRRIYKQNIDKARTCLHVTIYRITEFPRILIVQKRFDPTEAILWFLDFFGIKCSKSQDWWPQKYQIDTLALMQPFCL